MRASRVSIKQHLASNPAPGSTSRAMSLQVRRLQGLKGTGFRAGRHQRPLTRVKPLPHPARYPQATSVPTSTWSPCLPPLPAAAPCGQVIKNGAGSWTRHASRKQIESNICAVTADLCRIKIIGCKVSQSKEIYVNGTVFEAWRSFWRNPILANPKEKETLPQPRALCWHGEGEGHGRAGQGARAPVRDRRPDPRQPVNTSSATCSCGTRRDGALGSVPLTRSLHWDGFEVPVPGAPPARRGTTWPGIGAAALLPPGAQSMS